MWEVLPPFIPTTVVGKQFDAVWKGARDHIGPVEQITPFIRRLAKKTTCATVSICAGVLLWGAWRLKGLTEVDYNIELAEAAFVYQIDWRYVDPDAGPMEMPPDQPPPVSAMTALNQHMRWAINRDEYWNSYSQPIFQLSHAVHIIRHIVPKTALKDFDQWLKCIVELLDVVAPKPDEPPRRFREFASREEYRAFCAPHRGQPLPPEVIDPAFDYKPELREELVAKFLQEIDWRQNRYLRSPDAMLKLGFTGTPYRLA